MTTDENWIHEDNPSWFRKQALPLQNAYREWEKTKRLVYIPHPTLPETLIIKYYEK